MIWALDRSIYMRFTSSSIRSLTLQLVRSLQLRRMREYSMHSSSSWAHLSTHSCSATSLRLFHHWLRVKTWSFTDSTTLWWTSSAVERLLIRRLSMSISTLTTNGRYTKVSMSSKRCSNYLIQSRAIFWSHVIKIQWKLVSFSEKALARSTSPWHPRSSKSSKSRFSRIRSSYWKWVSTAQTHSSSWMDRFKCLGLMIERLWVCLVQAVTTQTT